MNKIKVLVVPSWYPNGQDALMGKYHIEFCEALAANGFDVAMLVVDRARLKDPVGYIKSKKHFIRQHRGFKAYCVRMLNVGPISFSLQQKSYEKALEKAYKRYEKELGRPDVIHAMVTVPAGSAAARLGEKLSVPVVITEHASYFKRFFEGREGKYGRYALEHCTMTAVSSFMAREFSEDLGKSCQVLPNLVDTGSFCPTAMEKSDTLRLLTVTALRQGKQVGDGARAVKKLLDSGKIKSISYTVAGDGFLEEQYKKEVRELGLENVVTFVGRKTKEELAALLKNSDILLVTSQYETFCIPAMEALAAGRPVVSTKCRGPEEFLEPCCAELCNVNDPDDMAEAIYRMYMRLDSFDPLKTAEIAGEYSGESLSRKAAKIYLEAMGKTE